MAYKTRGAGNPHRIPDYTARAFVQRVRADRKQEARPDPTLGSLFYRRWHVLCVPSEGEIYGRVERGVEVERANAYQGKQFVYLFDALSFFVDDESAFVLVDTEERIIIAAKPLHTIIQ
jgi:hypothetical protein